MYKNFVNKTAFLCFSFFLTSCAYQEKNDWVSAHGKYGQTWINGNLITEVHYDSTKECVDMFNQQINNDINIRKEIIETKNLSLLCSANPSPKKALDDDGLATGGLAYEGYLRLVTSNEKYVARFPNKKICEIIKADLKTQNNHQDLVCP